MKGNRGIKSPNANTSYLLSRSKAIYQWIVTGYTMTDIAKKLKVSRSWLFEQFNENKELNELRQSAYAARKEAIENTLYRLATGNYKTTVIHTQTITTKKGNEDAQTVSVTTEDIFEHIDNPNMTALGIIQRTMAMNNIASEEDNTIEDTISPIDENSFSYVDVAKAKE